MGEGGAMTRAALFLAFFCIAATAEMPRYETKYYILYTDVPTDQAQEAALRMSRMAEEYHNRTSDFSGAVRTKFPFYLYQHRDDYLAAGGLTGTDGMFNGTALYAVAGDRLTDRTWHVVQHEGFHQFAAAVIGGERPMWINEGLAEYFGEALFTGDGFVSGVIPKWRLKRLRDEINAGKLLTCEQMMLVSNAEWNTNIKISNYDQAWSMVHFLAHGENGKYQKAFAAMMVELSRGRQPETAWNDNFGSAEGFEDRWKKWWLDLPDDPSADLYGQATVARLTSFLARATAQKQTFDSFEAFKAAAANNKLEISPNDWLPPTLLAQALAEADDLTKAGAQWTLVAKSSPQIQCKLSSGARCVGSFQLQHGQIVRVDAKTETKR
jgi:hypothetical protein